MSEQRFTKECGNNGMTCRIWDNGLPITTDEVVDTLNEQQATIEQLQRICETINSLYNKISHLKKENEQLKNELHMRKMSATIDLMSRR